LPISYHRHFHVFAAEVREGQLTHPVRLTGENKSSLPRYYYSAYDHEINPTWTRDGQAIVFVSNRGRIHGTGGLWRAAAVPGAQALELDRAPVGARRTWIAHARPGRRHGRERAVLRSCARLDTSCRVRP